MASHLCLLPCRVLIRDDWILKNHIDETISTSIALGLIVFSIALFIVLWNTGLRLREFSVDFSSLKGKHRREIDFKYLLFPNGCSTTIFHFQRPRMSTILYSIC